jgi:hypothetical protein
VGAAKAVAAKAALVEDADEVDHDVLSAKLLAQLRFIVDIAIVQGEARQHQQMLVLLAISRQHRDLVAVLDQPGNKTRSQKAGATEDANGCMLHGISEAESIQPQNRAAH